MSDDETTVLIVGPRRGGRPRAAEPREVLSLRCLPSEYDEVAKLAIKHGITVSDAARRLMLRGLGKPFP